MQQRIIKKYKPLPIKVFEAVDSKTTRTISIWNN